MSVVKKYLSMTTGNGLDFFESIFGTTTVSSEIVELSFDSPSPRRKFRRFNRNANVRASELDMAISACESHQRGLGFNVVFSGWVGGRKYKVVTRNYSTYVEEIFWFHVY